MIQRILSALLGVLFVVAVFLFTSLILAALLAVGLVAWGWLWWRTRDRVSGPPGRGGAVIEGEYRDLTQKE